MVLPTTKETRHHKNTQAHFGGKSGNVQQVGDGWGVPRGLRPLRVGVVKWVI